MKLLGEVARRFGLWYHQYANSLGLGKQADPDYLRSSRPHIQDFSWKGVPAVGRGQEQRADSTVRLLVSKLTCIYS